MEKKYCAAPWRGLHINFRGDVKTCCAGNPNLLGNINDDSITNILKGPGLIEIRESVKQGILHPEYCYNCIQSEKNGSSERDWHNNINDSFIVAEADVYDDHLPVIFDVRWNTTCNLSCNYCAPYCSSKWASLKKEFTNTDLKSYYKDVVEHLEKNQDHIKEVAIVGGEPLLLKENFHMLDVLPEETLVTLITNMNVDFDKNQIAQKLLKRKRVGWSMSFDNVGACFEYVRHGASWKLTDSNVKRVAKKFKEGHHGGIHAVYNLYNCTKLCELKQYADDTGITILWQTLFQPEELDPMLHNKQVRQLALNEVLNLKNKFELNESELNFFVNVENNLKNTIATTKNMSDKFLQHIDDMENKYHKDQKGKFSELWPELATLI